MRFYDIDGIEMDVQDPKLFIDEERYKEISKAIDELLAKPPGIDSSTHCHGADCECAISCNINCCGASQ